jgi:hypothetical protein
MPKTPAIAIMPIRRFQAEWGESRLPARDIELLQVVTSTGHN